jgi:putative tryptophan/tyrosine transport system substrate-binding protein
MARMPAEYQRRNAGVPRLTLSRRDLVAVLGVAAMVRPLVAYAQKAPMQVVGFLGAGSPSGFAAEVAAFQQGLKGTGWTVGQNVTIEYRWAEGHFDRLPGLAKELVDLNVAVIATSGGALAARAAKNATATIPIVFETGIDPIEAGLIKSFSHPGGNLTGITIATGELNPKRLDLLTELVPDARVIAILVNPNNSQTDHMLRAAQQAARAKGIRLAVVEARTEDEFEPAFVSLAPMHAGALLVGNDPFFYTRREQLVSLAARFAVPAIYEWREFAAIGGLASYGTSLADMYRRFGAYVGRMLGGAKPADLPVEQPTKFELVINLKTAQALGLTFPPALLARADEVIE